MPCWIWSRAGLLEELRKGVLRVQQPQVDPEQAVQAGQLEVVQGRVDDAYARPLQFHGDLPQLQALAAEGLEAVQGLRRKPLHDVLERLLLLAGAPSRWLASWASTYCWNLGCEPKRTT